MAIYRTVQLSFWTDNKVVDDFTPEDKYFYLYLFTNPQTNLCGCYEVSLTTMSHQTGYNRDVIERLLERFEVYHKVLRYSKETKEVLLLNWYKYNWTRSPKLDKPLTDEINKVKNSEFKEILIALYNNRGNGEIPYRYGMDTTVTVTVNNTNKYLDTNKVNNNNNLSKDNNLSITINNIISYLNNRLNTNYKSNTKETVKHIKARLNEGFTEEDFYTVIDKKADAWENDSKMASYLRPITLFGNKFEAYLNEVKAVPVDKPSNEYDWSGAIENAKARMNDDGFVDI